MTILVLEFSSTQRSVAVLTGPMTTAETVETGRDPAMIGLIEEALRIAQVEREQIECIAIGLGPGSYTGIRTAIALAQGWQLGGEVKLIGISSAQCLAAEAQAEGIAGQVDVMIDAQRNEFYIATFDISSETLQEITPLRLATLAEV